MENQGRLALKSVKIVKMSDENLQQLAQVLKQTLNPNATERKTAEVYSDSNGSNQNTCTCI